MGTHGDNVVSNASIPPPEGPPPEGLVREQLERLLADSRFVRSERLSRLLRYAVERTLAGEGEQLKEYAIALEVYGRPSSYDPSVDSLVRVEVSRLRSKLVEYYATSGHKDAVRIDFPKGTYVPVFISQNPVQAIVLPVLDSADSKPQAPNFRTLWAVAACVIVGLSLWVVIMRRGRTVEPAIPSIAILPFSSFSSDPDTDAFAAGLTEDVTTALSQAADWRVAAPGSTLPYRTRPDSVPSIGRQLHVGAVLVGTVRKADQRLRITAQLVNAADGYYLWAETFDRESSRRLETQTEVSNLIAHALSAQTNAFVSPQTGSPAGREARASSQHARDLLDRNAGDHLVMRVPEDTEHKSLADLMKVIGMFEHAIALDPGYAPAYAGLARAYSLAADFDDEMAEKANDAARRGLQIDDRLPEAHFVLAYSKFLRDWDLRGADREWRRTLELNPRDVTASRLYADCSAILGDWESGFAALHRAEQLVPDSTVIALQVGIMLYHARRYADMLAHARWVQQQHPDVPQVHWLIGLALEQEGNYPAAAAEFELCLRQSPRDARATPALGHVYGLLGRRGDVMRLIESSRDHATKNGLGPIAVSLMYLGLGDTDAGIAWCEKAYEVREPALLYTKLDPRFDVLRSHPRFAALLRQLSF